MISIERLLDKQQSSELTELIVATRLEISSHANIHADTIRGNAPRTSIDRRNKNVYYSLGGLVVDGMSGANTQQVRLLDLREYRPSPGYKRIKNRAVDTFEIRAISAHSKLDSVHEESPESYYSELSEKGFAASDKIARTYFDFVPRYSGVLRDDPTYNDVNELLTDYSKVYTNRLKAAWYVGEVVDFVYSRPDASDKPTRFETTTELLQAWASIAPAEQ